MLKGRTDISSWDYYFFLSRFACLFSFGVSSAFFNCSRFPLSFFPDSPMTKPPGF